MVTMFPQFNSKQTGTAAFSLAVTLVINTVLPMEVSALSTGINPAEENKAAIKESDKNLKTRIPNADGKRPPGYLLELRATQNVRPIGSEPVRVVQPGFKSRQEDIESDDEANVAIEQPKANDLVPMKEALNPFSLDATHIETIELRDALRAALGDNLDIEDSYTKLRAQKYSLISQAAGFLPDLNSGYNLFGISGRLPAALLGGTGGSARLPSSAQLLTAGFNYNAYQGGKVLFGTLEQRHRTRASQAALRTSVNDVLLEATKKYYELLLNEALLTIRIRAVTISQEQVRMNSAQERAGTATGLDVLQSQAQLASDEQNLVDQQNARRQSAIQLAHVLNIGFSQDFKVREKFLKKKRLVAKSVPIEQLLVIAIDRRPELKQYEELRLAAKNAIVVASAPLQPKVSLGGNVYGIGAGGSKLDPIYVLNFGIKWSLGGTALADAANIQKARWEARQSAVQAKKAFLDVFEQVRSSYDNSLASDKRIDRASVQIKAAEEELRIAKKRMEAGVGLNIDVLNAQRDLTQASINKAKAVVDFNVAQAQLLHDIGSMSVESLTNGYKI